MFMICILRDLNVTSLQIVIAWVINCSHVTRRPHVVVTLAFPKWAFSAVLLSGMSTQRDRKRECSMTGSLCSFSEEAPILVFLHDYACSKIRIVVAIHGSCNLIESIPFDMNNFLDIPGDCFWCHKGGHIPNCLSLKWILQFIRQLLVNTLSVCKLCFGNKHTILMTNVATSNNMI